jgi:hypothetical protein
VLAFVVEVASGGMKPVKALLGQLVTLGLARKGLACLKL